MEIFVLQSLVRLISRILNLQKIPIIPSLCRIPPSLLYNPRETTSPQEQANMANKAILTACLLLMLLVIAFGVQCAMAAQVQEGACIVASDCKCDENCYTNCLGGHCYCIC
ncbi:unnamed protein product [Musa acuminata subsp. malaccensis]|uniref:(wild Malaysian banana) hypothetical protein n=1 Tax=Musa acuminata subsp. malaccensis TaxID=214687 RepID=A0A804IJD7_MUSAM|nr:PREDICTED: uncharacterized protein LOC103980443 isoform X2 [Musa acuminata subsp. malaccensis]CAG1840774.1 unnamed protein product [Musa acuminata subsp. malaccensis]